jgi:hypothetical protein
MCRGATAHRDPPPQGGRETCRVGRPRAMRAIPTAGGAVAAEVEDGARGRTVRPLVAARPLADRRQADTPGRPNWPE